MDLANKQILVTREATQAVEFNQMIETASGKVLSAPLLKINPMKFKHINLNDYNWIFFTSANGVECFLKQMSDKTFLKTIKIAAVGHKTENALKKYNVTADFIPTVYNADKMSKEFLEKYPLANHILLIRGNLSRDVLPNYFSKKQLDFKNLVVYETIVNKQIKSKLNYIFETEKIDYITFMSPSTIRSFLELLDDTHHLEALETQVICIGTTTERIALEHGFKHVSIPNHFTADSMLEKIAEIERMTI